MKLSRIDNNKICYFLNQDDLDHYNLSMKDLAYGSEKSKALMTGLIDQLSKEINFNPEHSNLSVELIPLEDGELKIEVSTLDDDDDLNILFSNVIKEYGQMESSRLNYYLDEELVLTDDASRIATSSSSDDTNTPFTQAFELESLDDAIHISHIIKQVNQLKSSLYKDPLHSKFLLVLETSQKDADIRGICNLIAENAGKPNNLYTIKSYCEEHLDLIIKNNALEQLSMI